MLVQIILANLLLSFDNVVVITSSTKNLRPRQSNILRTIGICFAPLLVLLFTWLVSSLLSVPMSHIRIIGGVLLIYVNYNMLRQLYSSSVVNVNSEGLAMAILAIVSSNLTLSLENSIFILSIITKNSAVLGIKEIVLIAIALLINLPILLYFSKTISYILEKYRIIIYLCAGYMIFSAVIMIIEDELIQDVFRAINFSLTIPTAILISIMIVTSIVFSNTKRLFTPRRFRGRIVFVAFATLAYSMVTIIRVTYISTDSIFFAEQQILGFLPSGANAVYTLAAPPHIFPIFMIVLSGIFLESSTSMQSSIKYYLQQFKRGTACMISFVIFYVIVCTVGLTNTLGFGEFDPYSIIILLCQVFVLAIYLSIFFFIRSLWKNKVIGTLGCLMFAFLESLLVEIFVHIEPLKYLASFFPDFYSHVLNQSTSPLVLFQLLITGSLALIGILGAGAWFYQLKN